MNIIGINGFKRSGKGETHLAIERTLSIGSLNVKGVGFADKLKIIAARSLGFRRTDQECIDLMDSFKETALFNIEYDEARGEGGGRFLHELTGREFLQNLGNDARQVFGDTFWIDQVLPNPNNALSRSLGTDAPAEDILATQLELRYPDVDVLCITDLRYENEAERVKALGGINIEVIRPGLKSDGHASEQPLPRHLIDAQVVNDSTLDDLERKVTRVLAQGL